MNLDGIIDDISIYERRLRTTTMLFDCCNWMMVNYLIYNSSLLKVLDELFNLQ